MGDPEGLANTISYGNVISYGKFNSDIEDKYLNDIKFEVIYSNSFGSSGGALLDSNLKIAGIQFATASDSNGN